MKKTIIFVPLLLVIMSFFFISSCNKDDNMSSALNIKAVVIPASSVRSATAEEV